jgi:hypothetical protein
MENRPRPVGAVADRRHCDRRLERCRRDPRRSLRPTEDDPLSAAEGPRRRVLHRRPTQAGPVDERGASPQEHPHNHPSQAREPAGDLLNRDFTAPAPNTRWVADFTFCRRTGPVPSAVPLIVRLPNRPFRTEIDRLINAQYASAPVRVRAAALCRCGCGREITASRKFVSQAHYNVWLSRERFVGQHPRRYVS